ncbi:MAG: UDP-3-O-(3-hydroxymyristoyl)glucosamine N-acyltransferase [Cyclobacteriaceae bacterium]|nr:UDP-3-O-(3-hydroxymyristoyl)glucosamine N-acyltransferase [Cyclobacteriaceae bacterium]
MEFTINQLAALLEGEVRGDGSSAINRISPLESAEPGSISFLHNPQYESLLYTTNASAVIVSKDLEIKDGIDPVLILVADPYDSLTTLLKEYEKFTKMQKVGVEDPCYLGKNSKVGDEVYRGAFSYIGQGVTIGHQVKIYPQVFIGDNVTIGDGTVIYPGAKIYANSEIGNHCVIQAGAVIGSEGFGFAPQEDGSYRTIPQVGKVVLHDHVTIGANTTIDRATLEATVIGQGVKLDNLIQIAHNVEIGENTAIAAQAGISGSTKIGKNCIIAGQVGVVGHIDITEKVTIAAQSGIGKSIKTPGSIIMGSPAFEIGPYKRSYAVFRNLPKIAERINELEKKVLNLPASSK